MTNEFKNAIAFITVCFVSVVLLITVIYGAWYMANAINHTTSDKAAESAQNNAQKALYETCAKQFRTGVFNEQCVLAVAR